MGWYQGREACLKAQGVAVLATCECHLVPDSEKGRHPRCNSMYPSVKWDTAWSVLPSQRNPIDACILKYFCPVLKKVRELHGLT